MRATFREKMRYKMENFMAKGGKSIFLSLMVLFVVSFTAVLLIKAIILFIATGDAGKTLTDVWIILMQLMDPGTVAGAQGADMRIVGMVATLLGVVIFSMLIAFITTQLEALIYTFRKGQSKVLESGHTIILGWDDRVTDIIKALINANESVKKAGVVILAQHDKELMDDHILKQIPDSMTTKIVTRNGAPMSLTELKRINAMEAKSAIILASCSDNAGEEEKESSDTRTMKTIMALIACQDGDSQVPIISEIFSEEKRGMVQYFESDHILSLDSWDILGKLMVQTSLTSGLEIVYNEMLSFDGCEVYFTQDEWEGKLFYDLAFHYQDGVPLGIFKQDKSLLIRPPADTKMEKDDQILILAQDDSTIQFKKNPVIKGKDLPFTLRRSDKMKKRILIIGWHEISSILIREYADYLEDGSEIDVIMRHPSEKISSKISSFQLDHSNLQINLHEANPFNLEELQSFRPYSYQNVIILSQNEVELSPEKIDSDTLMILFLLRKIAKDTENKGHDTKVITQVLNSENQELITQTDVDDFIISNKLITMILAQLSEQPDIKKLYDDIFQEEGSEIYVKPATLYFDKLPISLSFADLMLQTNKREEICLGIRKGALSKKPAENFGVVLDPPKNTVFEIGVDDFLVVLAEDEL